MLLWITISWRLIMSTHEDFEDCPLQNIIRDGGMMNIFRTIGCMCFVNRKSSKSEGKFPTFRSGNPHYPKETCREFSFFPLSSRKESSIHCFLPNRVIRVRLCQRLHERFAFNVLSFDSAPAPG